MKFITKNQTQRQLDSGGFTLIEVLAGILMATVFVLITSQAIAISALYRVRAQRESEAQLWIQENFEDLKFKSIQSLTATSCGKPDPADDSPLDGYAAALATELTGITPTTASWSIPTIETAQLLNKDYRATRTLSYYNVAPYHVMTVNYSITDPEVPDRSLLNYEIATYYTEVIPDAAFNCP